MACLTVKYTRVGEGMKAIFGEVCGTDIGDQVLYDKNGAMLLDNTGAILIGNKQ